jgi:hypothetical protein
VGTYFPFKVKITSPHSRRFNFFENRQDALEPGMQLKIFVIPEKNVTTMKTLLILSLLAVSLTAHALPRIGGTYTLSPETGSADRQARSPLDSWLPSFMITGAFFRGCPFSFPRVTAMVLCRAESKTFQL